MHLKLLYPFINVISLDSFKLNKNFLKSDNYFIKQYILNIITRINYFNINFSYNNILSKFLFKNSFLNLRVIYFIIILKILINV